MNFTAYVSRAFCHNSLGGNPAGVVIVNQALSFTSTQMQNIAKELNFSETVFISSLKDHTFKALYFTPNSSIDFCGHATLAAFGVLRHLKLLNGSVYSLDTQVGKCTVSLKNDLFFLSQPLPIFGEKIDKTEITSIFGNDISIEDPPPCIISTGLRDIFVCVKNEKCLQSLNPNLTLLSKLNRKTDSIGMHVFSHDVIGNVYTAHCRNFAPLYAIDEEAATGTSNGALGCHLFQEGLLPQASEHNLIFRQGDSLNSPSDIYVHLTTDHDTIKKVECGGEVVIDETRNLKI